MGAVRFAFALLVACSHAGLALGNDPLWPRLAVTGFYVISGFYIQFIITETYGRQERWVAKFYASRLLRLFPLYFLVLAATVGLQVATGESYPTQALDYVGYLFNNAGAEVAALAILSNLFILGQDVLRLSVLIPSAGEFRYLVPTLDLPRSLPAMNLTLLGQSWSLALELWFYLLAPWLLKRNTAVVIGAAVASGLLRVGLMVAGYGADWRVGSEWVNAFFPTELAFFCLGALAARAYLARPELPGRPAWSGPALSALVIAVLYGGGPFLIRTWPYLYLAYPLLVAACLPGLFRAFRHSPRDALVGEMSYPLYMVHFLAIHQAGALIPSLGRTGAGLVAVAASILLSWLVLLLLDRPLTRLRHRLFLPASTDPAQTR